MSNPTHPDPPTSPPSHDQTKKQSNTSRRKFSWCPPDIQALTKGALRDQLPELYALQAVVENSDWHTDDVFQQSLRLYHWLGRLPATLIDLGFTIDDLRLALPFLEQSNIEGGTYTGSDLLQFAALIHDVGKKETAIVQADGHTRCPDHEAVGATLAGPICARFDFTPAETGFITHLVRAHGQPYELFKAVASLPAWQQQIWRRCFEWQQAGHLLPLLLLAYGDLVTSDLRINRPEKYEAVLDFYRRWIFSIVSHHFR